MNEILNKGGSLQGERHAGILWSTDDAFAQVMGKERCSRVRGVSFGPTPTEEVGPTFHVRPVRRPVKRPIG